MYSKFRFTHIPKCGGTSIRAFINTSALECGIEPNEIYIPGFNKVKNEKNISQLDESELANLKARNIKIYAGHNKHNLFESVNIPLENAFNFTLLREPVARFISHYNFFNYKLGYNGCKNVLLQDIPEDKRHHLMNKLGNAQTHYIADVTNFRRMGPKNFLRIAKYNLAFEYDIVGTLEEIDTVVNELREIKPIGMEFNSNLPEFNTNKQKSSVPSTIIDEIKHFNALDIELYKFAQNLKHTEPPQKQSQDNE